MRIGIEPRQYEFECPCGHIWIDSQNNGCPMCCETVGISAEPYRSLQPETFARLLSKHRKLKIDDLSNKRCYLKAFYRVSYKDGYLFISIRDNYIEISEVNVHKKGKGTGTKMMQKTLAYICANWPNKKIIWVHCYTERLNWYKRLGFIVVKTHPEPYCVKDKKGEIYYYYEHELVYNIK